MFGAVYVGQSYLGQGYPGDQSAVVYTFTDASETTIGVTTGVRRVRSARVVRTLAESHPHRTIGETA